MNSLINENKFKIRMMQLAGKCIIFVKSRKEKIYEE